MLKSIQHKSLFKDLAIHLVLLLSLFLKFWNFFIPKDRIYHAGDFVEVMPMREYFYQTLRNGHFTFWDNHFATGLPFVLGDPWSFYPFDFIIGAFAVSYNIDRLEIISLLHYWLAGIFTYYYQRQNALSRLSSLISALCFMLGGFLLVHSHHPTIIHAMVWLPGILLFIDKAIMTRKPIYALLSGILLSLSLLGGHPQFFYYILLFLSTYYFFWLYSGRQTGESGRRVTTNFLLMLIISAGLAALQWLPLLTASNTIRKDVGYGWSAQFSFPFVHLLNFLVPSIYRWTGPGLSEDFSYMGVLPVLLGIWAATRSSQVRLRYFGLTVLFFFLLAIGDQIPLYKFFYDLLPGFDIFRIPSRFNSLFCFSLAVLAGYGCETLLPASDPRGVKGLHRFVRTMFLFSLAAAIFIYLGWLAMYVFNKPASPMPLEYWGQLTSGVSFYLLILGAGLLVVQRAWRKQTVGPWLFSIIFLDLLLVGWNFDTSLGHHITDHDPARVANISKDLAAEIKKDTSMYRILSQEELIPSQLIYDAGLSNIGLEGMTGFGPSLLPEEYIAAIGLLPHNPDLLDLLNVKYIVSKNFNYPDRFIAVRLDPLVHRKTIQLQAPVDIQKVTVQSQMNNSHAIAQGQPVVRMDFHSATGKSVSLELRAGIETSESSIDNPKWVTKHKRTNIHSSWNVPGEKYQEHSFAEEIGNLNLSQITSVSLEYIHNQGSIMIHHLWFDNQSIDRSRKKRFEKVNEYTYRNTTCLPRVFTVSPSATFPNKMILKKEMEWVDPREYLLIDDPPNKWKTASPMTVFTEEARVTAYEDNRIVIQAQTGGDRILVLSDGYHPWWKASIDGRPAQIIKVYGWLRGLPLTEGAHRVEFTISPKPFYYGLVISIASILLLVVGSFMLIKRSKT